MFLTKEKIFGSNASLSSVSETSTEIGTNEGSVAPVTERGDPHMFKICKSEEEPAACGTQEGYLYIIQILPMKFVSYIVTNGKNDHFDQQVIGIDASKLLHQNSSWRRLPLKDWRFRRKFDPG